MFRGISKYHHFRFTSVPGVIFVRVSPTAEEERISLIKPNVHLTYLLMLSSHQRRFDGALKRRAKRHQSVTKLD